MKVLLVGHACGPGRGSEPASTWNLAWELARSNEVWVLTHPQHRSEIEDYCKANPNANLHFVWVELSRFDPWKPARGERGVRLHYLFWLAAAVAAARRLHRTIGFDVIHHVSLSTISAPPVLWQLSAPFVWGPVGGGQCSPSAFRSYFGRSWLQECVRTLRVKLMPYSNRLRRTVAATQMVLASNTETLQLLQRAGASRIRLFLDSGIDDRILVSDPWQPDRTDLTLLWAGRLERIKALPLLLQAMALATNVPVRLIVAGDGSQRPSWEKLSGQLALQDRVQFVGQRSRTELSALMRSSDAFVFTSLRDSFGSVVLEALAHSLPVIALDHQGVGTFLPADACVKLTVASPPETIQALAATIRRLAQNREALKPMRRAALDFAQSHTWARRAERMNALYQEITSAYRPI